LIEQEDPGILTFVGVDDTSLYAPNPEGRSTSISVVAASFKLEGNPPGDVQLIFFNGVTDAPSVDVVVQGGAVVVDSLPYGEAADQLSLLAASYLFDVIRHGDGVVLGSFSLDISGYGDQVVAMLLSGFVDPAANQNGPAMSLDVLETGVQVVGVQPTSGERALPASFHLSQNYPNPFNPGTRISFAISHRSLVTLRVYDLLGREVATLLNGMKNPGTYEVAWIASGEPTGIYFYQLRAGDYTETRKLVLLR
jgi:hypothetical protein